MHINKKLIPALLAMAVSGVCHSAPTAQEIEQLGTILTPWGAEKAGNADGTIPEYTGGVEIPANYDPNRPEWRPDPFPDDGVLIRIDANNMEEHKERLTPGTMELMRKYPDYYINVYQTHRSVGYPQEFLDNSIKNASRCEMINDGLGLDTSKGCGFGIAFPLPKSGLEVMWNLFTRYAPPYVRKDIVTSYVKSNGEIVIPSRGNAYNEALFYNTRTAVPDSYMVIRGEYTSPTRMNGVRSIFTDMLKDSERRSYAYSPATRRVRLTPDAAADMPVADAGGALTHDDANLFSGKTDRYDWKLMGKKEVYIPYNNYRLSTDPQGDGCTFEQVHATAHFINPECMRWELHRVWEVEATLKPGKRHVYRTRHLFLDEDSYNAGISENYDMAGNLYRVNQLKGAPAYDVPSPPFNEMYVIDLISGVYMNVTARGGQLVVPSLPPTQLTGDSLSRSVLGSY